MNAAARAASTSAVIALALAAAWFFWPVQLGGATTYVSTYGISMEPGFSTGDLAVLRPADSYEVGDVVAYHSEILDTKVMHRIVDVDGDRFVLQGDNNDWLDEDRPTADELLGKLFRQVPQGGRMLDAITSPWSLGLIAAVVLGLFGTSDTVRRARGRRRGRHAPRRTSPVAAVSFSMPTRAQARQVAIVSGAVALLAAVAGAALLALPTTTTETRTLQVAQEGRFAYTGTAAPGTTYPTGAIATGDPIYTRLVDDLAVSFEQVVSAPGLDAVEGVVRLDLSVATADGWSAPLGDSPAVAVEDGAATATVPIDPDLARAAVDRHNAEIGGSAGTATIIVTPVVEITGVVQGAAFTAEEVPALTFAMDPTALRPPTSESTFEPNAQVAVPVDEVVARSFTLLGIDLPIDAARLIVLAVLVVAAVVTAATGWIGRPRSGDAADEFAVRNAARILPVAGLSTGPHVVDVSDADALRRVAERFDGLVLHHAGPEGQTFAVQDAETTYRFVFPDTAVTRTPPPPPPAVRPAPAPATMPLPRVA
ncbi:signal peptidase I [Candidatus Blastococcus massiliensis]|uniref:signal peptidase I n=1 Tax=Candidatus Blastococcus massiliensis TaxID=1470358 RepID=UPI0004AF07AB|nr:signal peptidase I [Candidatus Blastococcus massiliensis]